LPGIFNQNHTYQYLGGLRRIIQKPDNAIFQSQDHMLGMFLLGSISLDCCWLVLPFDIHNKNKD
jgi:hypothetical protein